VEDEPPWRSPCQAIAKGHHRTGICAGGAVRFAQGDGEKAAIAFQDEGDAHPGMDTPVIEPRGPQFSTSPGIKFGMDHSAKISHAATSSPSNEGAG